jgi:hypothetical protein
MIATKTAAFLAVTGVAFVAGFATAQSVHQWETAKAYWLPANPPGTRHQDVNVSNEPIEVMVVELQNEK